MSLNYPPKIYEVAQKAPMYKLETVTSWEELQKNKDEMLEHTYRQAAYKISNEFARTISEHLSRSGTSEPYGYTVRFSSVALRYDELLELLYTAYREGQTDGMRRDFSPNFIGVE